MGYYKVVVKTKNNQIDLLKGKSGWLKASNMQKTQSVAYKFTQPGNYTFIIYAKKLGSKKAYDAVLTKTLKVNYKEVTISKKNTIYTSNNPYENIYVKANNITLKNIKINGKIKLDPGSNGTVYLYNIQSPNIEILSGGENSIHFNNVSTDKLIINSEQKNKIRTVTDTKTRLGTIEVNANVLLENNSANVEKIILNADSQKETTLKGTFKNIIVNDNPKINLASANVESLTIDFDKEKNLNIKGEGQIKNIEILKPIEIILQNKIKVTDTIKIQDKATLKSDKEVEINKVEINSKNNQVSISANIKELQINEASKVELKEGSSIENIKSIKSIEVFKDKDVEIKNYDSNVNINDQTKEENKEQENQNTQNEDNNNTSNPPIDNPPAGDSTSGTTGGSLGGGTQTQPETITVSSINILNKFEQLKIGEAKTINAEVLLSNNTKNYDYIIISSNPSVIEVNGKTIKALKEGTATITAKASTKTDTFTVNVVKWVKNITVINPPQQMKKDDVLNISATVQMADNTIKNEFSLVSSNPSVISVSGKTITALSKGTATIRAYAEDKNYEFTVTVSDQQDITGLEWTIEPKSQLGALSMSKFKVTAIIHLNKLI